MPIPIFCIGIDDVSALEIAGSVLNLGVAFSAVSLVWRQTPTGKDARSGPLSGPGAVGSTQAGALARWPGIDAINVRDVGQVIAAGGIRNAFDGTATGKPMHLAQALAWAGIPKRESRYYAGLVYAGGVLVLALVADQVEAEEVGRCWGRSSARAVSCPIWDPA